MNVEILFEPRLGQVDDQEKTYLVQRGGQSIQYYPFTAQSSSNSSIVFKCDPPSFDTIIDRNAIIRVPVTIVVAGSNPTGNGMFVDGGCSLRAYPFSSCVQSLTCNINGQSITQQVADIVHVLSRYNNDPISRSAFGSIFPNTLDVNQSYAEGTGSQNTPLSSYDSSVPGVYIPRGAYPINLTANDDTGFTFTTDIYEYVNISPFYHRNQQGIGGLANVRNLTFNYQLANLARMLSINTTLPGGSVLAINNVNVTIGTPTMYMGFVTPPEGFRIPRTINYNYHDLSFYSNSFGTNLAAGSSQQYNSNVLQFAQLPERVYLCVRRSDAFINANVTSQVSTTDTFARINSININFNNVDDIQSATTPIDLYTQSVRNGCSMSWAEWNGNSVVAGTDFASTQVRGCVGGVVCLEFAKDLPLRNYDAVGMSKSWNFQVTMNVTNTSSVAYTPQLVIVAQYDGILTLEAPGQAQLTLGFITPQDVANAKPSSMSFNTIQKLNGGGPSLSQVAKFIKHPFVKGVAKAACDAMDKGSGIPAGGIPAGALVGGASMSKQSLKSRAIK